MVNSGHYAPGKGQHSGTVTEQQAVWRERTEGQRSGTREATGQQAVWRERMEGQHPGRQLHGIGMVSVRQIVDKYQGTFRIWEEEGRVRQKLILVQRSGQEEGAVQGETE